MRPPKKRRPKKPTLMVGKTKVRGYLQSDSRGAWIAHMCLGGTSCPRTPTQLKLCKQACNTCVRIYPGETLDDVVKRLKEAHNVAQAEHPNRERVQTPTDA